MLLLRAPMQLLPLLRVLRALRRALGAVDPAAEAEAGVVGRLLLRAPLRLGLLGAALAMEAPAKRRRRCN